MIHVALVIAVARACLCQDSTWLVMVIAELNTVLGHFKTHLAFAAAPSCVLVLYLMERTSLFSVSACLIGTFLSWKLILV